MLAPTTIHELLAGTCTGQVLPPAATSAWDMTQMIRAAASVSMRTTRAWCPARLPPTQRPRPRMQSGGNAPRCCTLKTCLKYLDGYNNPFLPISVCRKSPEGMALHECQKWVGAGQRWRGWAGKRGQLTACRTSQVRHRRYAPKNALAASLSLPVQDRWRPVDGCM